MADNSVPALKQFVVTNVTLPSFNGPCFAESTVMTGSSAEKVFLQWCINEYKLTNDDLEEFDELDRLDKTTDTTWVCDNEDYIVVVTQID